MDNNISMCFLWAEYIPTFFSINLSHSCDPCIGKHPVHGAYEIEVYVSKFPKSIGSKYDIFTYLWLIFMGSM